MALVASIWLQSGRTQESGGRGFDGAQYAAMTEHALYRGGDNARMRPLVILINQLVYDFAIGDVIAAFQVMNFVYAGLLALVVCGILDFYGVSVAHKLVFALNVFATIAVTKMFAFYPVLIDLGAYLFVTLAVYAILRGHRALIVVSTVLAVFAREFGLLAVVFGIHRDLRLGHSRKAIAVTYAPAIVAFVALRQWVLATATAGPGTPAIQGGLVSVTDIVANLSRGPSLFLLFLAYFGATVFGGISLLLVTRAISKRIRLGGEREWLTYLAALGVMLLAPGPDVWRYLAFALPVAAALYAKTVAFDDWRVVAPWVAVITVVTQQPWLEMTDLTYFHDWFPLYLPQFGVPDDPSPKFWTAWVIRFIVVACLAVIMWAAQRPGARAVRRFAGREVHL
jgi:hypothetical protein